MEENREYIPQAIRESFIPYELALNLQHPNTKEVKYPAFDTECIAFWNHYQEIHFNHTYSEYNQHLKAPTYDQIIDWLYKQGISLEVYTCSDDLGKTFNHMIRKVGRKLYEIKSLDNKCVPNRYEAYNKGIKEALKLIK